MIRDYLTPATRSQSDHPQPIIQSNEPAHHPTANWNGFSQSDTSSICEGVAVVTDKTGSIQEERPNLSQKAP